MGKELVVSSDRHETKVAILEEGQLVEVYFQRANEYSLAGSIHKGRVTRVLPGMQSAFVDLGLERDTFLYVSDFFEDQEDFDKVADDRRGRQQQSRFAGASAPPEATASAEVATPVSAETASATANGELSVSGEGSAVPREERRFDDRRDVDRRGRGRRRRRGGAGAGRFPDAKFAPAPAQEPLEARAPSSGEEEPEPIVLPGESLRKYRRDQPFPPTPASVEIEPTEAATAPVEAKSVEEEPPRLVSAVPEPDAPIHHPVMHEGELPVEAAVEVEEAEIVEVEEPGDFAPDFVSEEVPQDISSFEAAEQAEDISADKSDSDAGQPPLEPMTHTAHLREPAVRFLEQRPQGRRNRRRGRGDRDRGYDRQGRPQQSEERQEQGDRLPRTQDRGERTSQPSISELLKEGQEILVQIAKEPLGQKGARITSHIALPGRFCVYMPTVEHTGVSRKIASDEERQRLKKILLSHRQGIPGGFIIRTAGEGKSESEIAADIRYLYNLWLDIRQKAEQKKAPAVIYRDLEIVERILRDQLSDEFKAIWCDSEGVYESVLSFVQRTMPLLIPRVKMFTRDAAIFDAFNISSELEKALRPKVWLKSGGYIVINQTEALVAIDINTGKFIGKTGRLEDTIVKTNIEAVKEIVRQIRLRDLGGIIVIDFIDMDERKNRQKVMQALEEAMRADRAPYKILQFNDFGLVAITRKRVKQSLERTLCQPCPYCEGAGYVRSVATVISEILAEARKIAAAVEGKECLLRVNPEVAKVLKSTSNTYVEELEEVLKRPVGVIADPLIHHEKFDLS